MPITPNASLTPVGSAPPRLDPAAVGTVAGLFVAFTSLTVLLLRPTELAGRAIALAVGVGLSILALGLGLLLSGRRRPPAAAAVAAPPPTAAQGPVTPTDEVAEQLGQAWAAQRGTAEVRSAAGPPTGPGTVRRLEPRRPVGAAPASRPTTGR